MNKQTEILQSLQPVLSTLAEAALASCDGASSHVWLVGPGDLCEGCPMRPECPSQAACLHLAASAGADAEGSTPHPRVPLGVGPLGTVPTTRAPLVARTGIAGLGLAGKGWLAANRVRSVAALPLVHGGRAIGVVAVFSRDDLPDERVRLLDASARLAATALGNVSAFRDLAAERNRLAAKNARLRVGLGLPPEPEPAPPPTPAPTPAPATPSTSMSAEPAVQPPVATLAPPPGPAATLPPATRVHLAAGVAPAGDVGPAAPRSFAEIQREGILRTLEVHGWRVSGPRGAAKALGLKPTTLESKMKKLGIRRPPR